MYNARHTHTNTSFSSHDELKVHLAVEESYTINYPVINLQKISIYFTANKNIKTSSLWMRSHKSNLANGKEKKKKCIILNHDDERHHPTRNKRKKKKQKANLFI